MNILDLLIDKLGLTKTVEKFSFWQLLFLLIIGGLFCLAWAYINNYDKFNG